MRKYHILLLAMLTITQTMWAQKSYHSRRWRLKFENDAPKSIMVTDPGGEKKLYWYIRYKVINNSQRDIRWMINMKLVIDKPKAGITESQVPGIFYQAKIPDGSNKEEYLNNLQAYYDSDLSIVKRFIMKKLGIYPELTKVERKILAALDEKIPLSVMDIKKKIGLSYQEIESNLIRLVVNNMAISQEMPGNSTFLEGKSSYALFVIYDQNSEVRIGETVNGWKLISFSKTQAVLQKEDCIKVLTMGNTMEYRYLKTGKIFSGRDIPMATGISAQGVYQGRSSVKQPYPKGKTTQGVSYKFKNAVIPAKSTHHGLAIFSDISPEMDYMALVVTGLTDPIVKRNRKVYIENEALIDAYMKPGDEFHTHQNPIVHLYRKWIVLSNREIKRN